MIRYKKDIMAELKNNGFTTTRIRKEKLIAENSLTKIRQGELPSADVLNKLCIMLRCQPNDLIEVIATDEEKIKYF